MLVTVWTEVGEKLHLKYRMEYLLVGVPRIQIYNSVIVIIIMPPYMDRLLISIGGTRHLIQNYPSASPTHVFIFKFINNLNWSCLVFI